MIYEIDILNEELFLSHWKDLNLPSKFEFKPGINFIVGPNGSGKSTILDMIAKSFYSSEGGIPRVSQEALWHIKCNSGKNLSECIKIKCGKPNLIYYVNTRQTIGIENGVATNSFALEGVLYAMHRPSSGQHNQQNFFRILDMINKGEKGDFDNCFLTTEQLTAHLEIMDDSEDKPTILIDEPEQGLDITLARPIWELIYHYSKKYQFIIASHSPFMAPFIHLANFIELEKDYLRTFLEEMQYLGVSLTYRTCKQFRTDAMKDFLDDFHFKKMLESTPKGQTDLKKKRAAKRKGK